ncbi:hypothetical protein P4310_31095 [Bacillus thuringiensis]|uniref:hypothetical protein n=1 Tax=Bacillus thuringiensis TaxID=1428 RepID=UPI000A3BEABE|nr:hypothetical protein [Bacillus thuringiensis]MED3069834.1 hypothetical protein [Bacillus thuringiensis]OUB26318.1 hypothetical protein BK737_25930 [Bacillus thuringiensis serovar palmanyolensis]OUB30742.1 hypothetical protein BK737_17140 [Bacillus thuringiensis serovar palmanyolensis]OUB30767.1 hypothetical protein BK737_17005 [Bacillus thuringiensis serovar palmanyolensis]OUB34511.1 hypothetical protein BK737_07905 [Bacillus thuringiensis serovar palmanyolensis]
MGLKIIKYLIYSFCLLLSIFSISMLSIKVNAQPITEENIFWVRSIHVLYVFVGVLIGGEKFLVQLKMSNQAWGFNFAKFISIGLPTLFFTLYPFLYFKIPFPIIPNFINKVVFLSQNQFYIVTAIIFGYVLITSLERKDTL